MNLNLSHPITMPKRISNLTGKLSRGSILLLYAILDFSEDILGGPTWEYLSSKYTPVGWQTAVSITIIGVTIWLLSQLTSNSKTIQLANITLVASILLSCGFYLLHSDTTTTTKTFRQLITTISLISLAILLFRYHHYIATQWPVHTLFLGLVLVVLFIPMPATAVERTKQREPISTHVEIMTSSTVPEFGEEMAIAIQHPQTIHSPLKQQYACSNQIINEESLRHSGNNSVAEIPC